LKGYMGKILHVDLSTGEIHEEEIADEVYEHFLTGVGIGTYVLYRDVPADADPLGPDNILGFTSGLLTGTASFMTGRWMVVCKSPLTGGIGDANGGGHFAPAIKQVGYDAIFFKGVSAKPVYLHVDHRGAELRDAAHVWGQDAVVAEEMLTKECMGRKKPRIALIGQAGEKLSLISGIVTDAGRIAARAGVGAVMGSKKLKAVVLNGSKRVKYHDPDGMKGYSQTFAEKVRTASVPPIISDTLLKVIGHITGRNRYEAPSDGSSSYALMKRFGTHAGTQLSIIAGDSPVKNWQGGPADYPTRDSNKINIRGSGIDKNEIRKYHCAQCAIGCGGIVNLDGVERASGKFTHTHKPEYETLAALGPMLLNTSPDSILYLNELLNRAGMDTISAGGTLAFAIECYENGLLTREQTGGLELTWGNHEAIVTVVEQMIARETWLGDTLADGARRASEIIGWGSEAYAITAGGQEPGMHDPRFSVGWGVDYSANPTPGRHTNGATAYSTLFLWERVSYAPEPQRVLKEDLTKPDPEYALGTVLATQYKMLIDAVGGCIMGAAGGVNGWDLFRMLELATGWNKTADDYMEIGNRINTLRQLFNVKHGIDPKDFLMHKRIETPRQSGPNRGRGVQMEPIVSLHWEKHGWDPNTGHPTNETVQRLGLDQFFGEVVR